MEASLGWVRSRNDLFVTEAFVCYFLAKVERLDLPVLWKPRGKATHFPLQFIGNRYGCYFFEYSIRFHSHSCRRVIKLCKRDDAIPDVVTATLKRHCNQASHNEV